MTNSCYAIVGRPYGHVPGHSYHDVEVSCYRDGSSAEAIETWGKCQVYDEEHGRRAITGTIDTLLSRAQSLGWQPEAVQYLMTALADIARQRRPA